MTQLADKIRIIKREKRVDERGWFLKIITGKEAGLPAATGEIYLTSALPGKSRGGHYHDRATEWFTLLAGECYLRLFDIGTREEMEVFMSAGDPTTVMVPPQVAHAFENRGDSPFLLAAYSSELYEPADTIEFTFR